MAVRIRLSRGGSKKRPFYKIVVADQRAPRDGRFIERLGSYNPLLPKDHAERLVLNQDKVKEWLGKGAQPTERLQNCLLTSVCALLRLFVNSRKNLLRKLKLRNA